MRKFFFVFGIVFCFIVDDDGFYTLIVMNEVWEIASVLPYLSWRRCCSYIRLARDLGSGGLGRSLSRSGSCLCAALLYS